MKFMKYFSFITVFSFLEHPDFTLFEKFDSHWTYDLGLSKFIALYLKKLKYDTLKKLLYL